MNVSIFRSFSGDRLLFRFKRLNSKSFPGIEHEEAGVVQR